MTRDLSPVVQALQNKHELFAYPLPAILMLWTISNIYFQKYSMIIKNTDFSVAHSSFLCVQFGNQSQHRCIGQVSISLAILGECWQKCGDFSTLNIASSSIITHLSRGQVSWELWCAWHCNWLFLLRWESKKSQSNTSSNAKKFLLFNLWTCKALYEIYATME